MAKQQPSTNFQLLVAATNLFIAAAGAGLLSYPYAVKSQGIALNIVLSVFFAAINSYTDLVLATTAFRVRRWLVALTYEEICLRVIGPWGYVAAVSTVIVGCLGVLVGFMVITADLAQPVVLALCTGSGGSAACDVVSHRAFILLVFAVGVALPFSSCERMHGLVASSAIAAITVIAVAVLVGAKGAEAMVTRGVVCAGDAAPASPYVDGTTVWFNLSAQAILGVPLIVFALGNHIQAPNVFLELGRRHAAAAKVHPPGPSAAASADFDAGWRTDAANPQLRFHVAVFCTLGLCACLYTLTGAFGYLACGASTRGDVLLNFPVGDPVAAVARALMAVHVVLAFPVVVLPCRKAIFMLAFFIAADARRRGGRWGRLCGGGGSGGGLRVSKRVDDGLPLAGDIVPEAKDVEAEGSTAVAAASTSSGALGGGDPHSDVLQAYRQLEHDTSLVCGMGCSPRHVFWNLLLVGGPAIVAVGVPQVQVVFGFLGSIISTLKIYVFPALMLLAWARQLDRAGAGSDAEDAQALLLPQAAAAHGASAGRLVPASVLPEGSPEPGDGERGAALGEKSRLVQPLPPPQAQRQSSASFSSSSASRQPAGDAQGTGRLPEFLPRSPFWLRVHACLLLTLATAVAVIGTAANIYYA